MMTRLLQSVLVVIPLALLVLVGVRYIDMDGTYRVTWEPGQENAFVHGFRPTGRVTGAYVREDGARVTRLHGDPIYLSISPPGDYESATIRTWVDAAEQPQVELGATVNADAGQILLRPLVHQTLDALDWTLIRQGDLALWQRRRTVDSIAAFLEAVPERSRIATYHYTLPAYETVPRTWTAGGSTSVNTVSLRGQHEFITATDGRDLALTIEYMDMNRNVGADPVTVRVYQGEQLVAEARQEDDGVVAATNASLERQSVTLTARGLSPGIVKVELLADTDIYWRRIDSSLPRMTFGSNVTIGDEVGYLTSPRQVVFWTDAQHLTLFTRHAEGVQTVFVGDQEVEIAQPHERYTVETTTPGLTRVTVPEGDLVVLTDGRVAFSSEQFFNPDSVKLDDRTDLDALDVDYVIATYPETQREGAFTVTETQFPLGSLEREAGETEETGRFGRQGSLRFVVSAPRVQDREAFVDIARLEVTFTRDARSIGDILRRAWERMGL